MFIETSKDLLFVVIAFCILWVTIFICWILYYLIRTTKRINDTVKSAKDKIDRVGEVIDLLKKKINEGASYVGAMVEGVIKLSEYFKERGKSEGADKKASKQVKKIEVKKK